LIYDAKKITSDSRGKNYTLDTLFQDRHIEVDQQTKKLSALAVGTEKGARLNIARLCDRPERFSREEAQQRPQPQDCTVGVPAGGLSRGDWRRVLFT
jgi:hypothetical protein